MKLISVVQNILYRMHELKVLRSDCTSAQSDQISPVRMRCSGGAMVSGKLPVPRRSTKFG